MGFIRMRNLLHTVLLIASMVTIAATVAWLVWGETAVAWVASVVAFSLAFSRNAPSKWILALLRAEPLSPAQWLDGYAIVKELSSRAGLNHTPRLYYLASPVPNAISLGRGKHSAIVITKGLLQRLNEREIAGVLAHEISHFRANDIGLLNLATILNHVTFLMAFSGLLLLVLSLPFYWVSAQPPPFLLILLLGLAPNAVTLLTLALSRTREFDADQGAAALTGDPAGLASALGKLEMRGEAYWRLVFPERAQMSPWLRSHPSGRERIEHLLNLTSHDA